MFDPRPVRRAIEEVLETVGVDMYVTEVPDDTQLSYSGGRMNPYLVVMYTNPILAGRGRGIVSVRKDPMRMGTTVHAIALENSIAEDIHAEVFDLLLGFEPPGATPLSPWGGFSVNTSTAKAPPTKYIHSQGFTTTLNMNV